MIKRRVQVSVGNEIFNFSTRKKAENFVLARTHLGMFNGKSVRMDYFGFKQRSPSIEQKRGLAFAYRLKNRG